MGTNECFHEWVIVATFKVAPEELKSLLIEGEANVPLDGTRVVTMMGPICTKCNMSAFDMDGEEIRLVEPTPIKILKTELPWSEN